ncbi:MAG TPA: gamma-glutamyltransferase, partial [Polyangiaceae bacterium]|nr:gamma-glutamyltransferase [Polyangiaceae bacterium]
SVAAEPRRAPWGVSTESAAATREAVQVLAEGGTAADAAIVAALVAGVTAPTSSGLGGGGFLLGYSSQNQKVYCLDFREVGPQALDPRPFEQRPLAAEQVGHLVGVPGEVKGLFALHERAGKIPWAQLLMRAERHAREGYFVSPHLAAMLKGAAAKLSQAPGLGGLYYPAGKPALVGARLTHPALGRTLALLAAQGPDGFYRGPVAQDIVTTARRFGSSLTQDDLARYQVRERTPLIVEFEQAQVYTMPAPSAGGLMMSQLLQLYSAEELRQLGHGTPAYQHLLAEGMRGAMADRMRYATDPDVQPYDVTGLTAPARMEKRRQAISLDRTHALPRFGLEEHGTHAIVVSDRDGNVVSLTTTVNRLFGAKIYADSTGIILNDELDDFSAQADVAPFDLKESPNRPRPGARPVSSMTPTIVLSNQRPVLALGGSGGMTIATNAVQVLLSALVFDHTATKAVSAPRIYIPTSQYSLMVEPNTASAHVQDLRERGEVVTTMPFLTSAIQLLKFSEATSGKIAVDAAADPRKHGLARSGN